MLYNIIIIKIYFEYCLLLSNASLESTKALKIFVLCQVFLLQLMNYENCLFHPSHFLPPSSPQKLNKYLLLARCFSATKYIQTGEGKQPHRNLKKHRKFIYLGFSRKLLFGLDKFIKTFCSCLVYNLKLKIFILIINCMKSADMSHQKKLILRQENSQNVRHDKQELFYMKVTICIENVVYIVYYYYCIDYWEFKNIKIFFFVFCPLYKWYLEIHKIILHKLLFFMAKLISSIDGW